jgi:hypothetical protein
LILPIPSRSWAEDLQFIVTDTARNTHHDDWEKSGKATDGTVWSVDVETLHGGKQDNVQVVRIDNGKLSMVVVPTRGMSVYEVVAGDVRLGWNSPVKEIVHPKFINLHDREGLGWLEGFNEWMVRCGLEFAGHPGTDVMIDNTGAEKKQALTLHGKIGNIPASYVEVIVTDADPPRIRVRGRVDERSFYGPQLELWTEISTEVGSSTFRIDDQLTNRGSDEQEFEIIYHANHGPPLLDKGAEFVGAVARVMPMNEHAAASIDNYKTYVGPTPGFVEQVYCITPLADDAGFTEIMLRNAAAEKAISMRFKVDELPYITLWKNTNTLANGYVTGLEPGTNFPFNRRVEREQGRLSKLAGGATRHFGLEFTVHRERTTIDQTEKRIQSLQAERRTTIDPAP